MSEPVLVSVSFRSRVDLWLIVLLAAVLAFAIVPAIGGLWDGPDGEDFLGAAIAIVVVLGVAAVTIPTRYILTSEGLVIQSGVFTEHLPYRAVLRVKRSWNPLAAPAASLKRLMITFRLQRFPQMVLISPVREEEFLDLLAERAGLVGSGTDRYRPGLAGRIDA